MPRFSKLSRNSHRTLDYVFAVVLAVTPFVFGFGHVPIARYTFLVLAAGLMLYSLLTSYEIPRSGRLPFNMHRIWDLIVSGAMLLGPVALAYEGYLDPLQRAVHYVLGVFWLAVTLGTTYHVHQTDRPADEPLDRAA